MRILFLSHYFPPEVNAPASRTFEHCKAWARAGHEVTVVTCAPNHPRGVVYQGFRNRLWQQDERDGIRVIRVWTFITANEGFVKRTLSYLSYQFMVTALAPFLPKSDVLISTSPQFFNGLAGYTVRLFKRVPWLLEVRDLWPESIVVVGGLKRGPVIRFLEKLEAFAYRKADAIVPVTDSFREHMAAMGVSPRKIEVIKNGVDLAFFKRHEGPNSLRAQLGLDGKFVAAYFGTHGMAHALETVLEAAALLQERTDIVFLLVGDGAERSKLKQMCEEQKLENVLMLDQQPKQNMPLLWDIANVSVVHLKRSALFKTVIPSKIFESMAMERPILMGVEGEAADIIRAAGAGICVEPQNAAQMADAVLRLASDPQLARQMGESGRAYVAENFDRNKLAARFEALLLKIANRGKTVQ